MNKTTPRTSAGLRAAGVGLLTLVLAACAGGSGAAWTYAPLGPTADANASPTAGPSGTPAASPGATIDVETPQENSLAFVPNTLEAPAGSTVLVNYNNNSNLPHNIHFFAGGDSTAESLGATPIVTGPDAPESVSITTPDEPGDYYFWCDVHLQAMAGMLTVQ
ncbi:MAG TPA: plastocyanin/azurin family copper-binding protein [Candidatus Limnocylindrales bacterium]|nr:plastocyanin/azurin family copper-binding protein [Candidatus Limnocylindrales bacterium]